MWLRNRMENEGNMKKEGGTVEWDRGLSVSHFMFPYVSETTVYSG